MSLAQLDTQTLKIDATKMKEVKHKLNKKAREPTIIGWALCTSGSRFKFFSVSFRIATSFASEDEKKANLHSQKRSRIF